jgi:hypothetical protein
VVACTLYVTAGLLLPARSTLLMLPSSYWVDSHLQINVTSGAMIRTQEFMPAVHQESLGLMQMHSMRGITCQRLSSPLAAGARRRHAGVHEVGILMFTIAARV